MADFVPGRPIWPLKFCAIWQFSTKHSMDLVRARLQPRDLAQPSCAPPATQPSVRRSEGALKFGPRRRNLPEAAALHQQAVASRAVTSPLRLADLTLSSLVADLRQCFVHRTLSSGHQSASQQIGNPAPGPRIQMHILGPDRSAQRNHLHGAVGPPWFVVPVVSPTLDRRATRGGTRPDPLVGVLLSTFPPGRVPVISHLKAPGPW